MQDGELDQAFRRLGSEDGDCNIAIENSYISAAHKNKREERTNHNIMAETPGSTSVRSLLCYIIAMGAIISFCVLLALGKYEWHFYPLLAAASICSLLYTTTTIDNTNIDPAMNTGTGDVHADGKRSRLGWTLLSRILPNSVCCSKLQYNSDPFDLERTPTKKVATEHTSWWCRWSTRMPRCCNKRGDPNMVLINIIAVLVPCLVYMIRKVGRRFAEMELYYGYFPHEGIANDFGKVSSFAMSAFLVPVARHSILLKSLGFDPRYGLRVHIFSGYVSVLTGLVHGIYWVYIWIWLDEMKFWDIFPPGECWTWKTLTSSNNDDDRRCSKQFVNLLGVLCGICFIGLSVTSIWWIRRNYYRFFYISHIGFSVLLLYGLVMHYNKMILYLAPSLVYYFASCIPALMQAFLSWVKGGTIVSSVIHIPDSGNCVELSFQMSEQHQVKESLCGKYVRLCVPEISQVWHPFTVYSHHDNPDSLKLTFRCIGPFTRELSNRLSLSKSSGIQYPKFLVDGYYGTDDHLSHALGHDNVIIAAGGVGIVSYISLINSLCSTAIRVSCASSRTGNNDMDSCQGFKTKKLVLHWVCRDEGLIKFVLDRYLNIPKETITGVSLNIHIYHTSKKCDSIAEVGPVGLDYNPVNDNGCVEHEIPLRGKPLVTNLLSTGHAKVLHNFPAAAFFSLLAWGGLFIILYFYNNVQSKRVVLTRTYSLIVISLYMSVLSICGVFIFQWLPHHRYSTLSTGESSNERSNKRTLKETVKKCGSIRDLTECTELSSDDSSLDLEVSQQSFFDIHHSRGRPNFDNDEFSAPHTCVFICGPAPLVKSVKECCKGGNSAIYEEIFEM